MHKIKKIKKILYLSFFLLIFFKIFIYKPFDNWYVKYNTFKVPVYSFPGADSRNIQKAAYCHSKGYDYYKDKKCFKYTTLVSKNYPNYTRPQPKYNYPPIVARIYEYFNNFSENFFEKFWLLNMSLVLLTILLYSYRINYILFPFLIFSPIVLLEIERANIDGLVFSILDVPLLLSNSVFLHTLSIGLMASIKIFPAICFLTLFGQKTIEVKKKVLAFFFTMPFILASLFYIKEYLTATQYSFDKSFGLLSFKYIPFSQYNGSFFYLFIIIYLCYTLNVMLIIYKKSNFSQTLIKNIKNLDEKHLNILLTSLLVYIFVFLVFTNWAYRFIFLIPAFLIISNFKDIISRITTALILISFWVPFLPNGWTYFNILNYVFFPFVLIIFIFTYKHHYFYTSQHS